MRDRLPRAGTKIAHERKEKRDAEGSETGKACERRKERRRRLVGEGRKVM